jgi:hypothetical protein
MTDSRCACGATLVRGALACSLCHTPVPAAVGGAAGGPAGAAGAAEPVVGPNGFLAAAPPSTQRNDQRVFSRTQAGPMSFGWPGRIVLTVLAALPIAFVYVMSGGGVITVVSMIPVLILPLWVIRESWRRGRVR